MKKLLVISFLSASHLFAAEIEWEAIVYPKDQLFPSQLAITATMDRNNEDIATWGASVMGDEFGVVGAWIAGVEKGQRVRLEIAANDILEESAWEGKVPSSEEEWYIFPVLGLRYEELISSHQTRPLSLRFKLFVDGEKIGEETVNATLRSINDCLFAVLEDEEDEYSEVSDFTWLFAGYVNESHPWVDDVLREALALGIVNQFDGYQSGDTDAVMSQIYSVWRVMQEMGLKYSDITTTSVEKEGVYSQHVRLFDESIRAKQANCVDGTVLLASVLRKIGLNTYLMLVPGHMFVSVDLDPDGEDYIGIETTLMGNTNLPAIKATGMLQGDELKRRLNEESMQTFIAAVEIGTAEIEKYEDAFEDESQPEFQYVDIQEARQFGIVPIAAKKTTSKLGGETD